MNIYEELVERIRAHDAAKAQESRDRELIALMRRRESFLTKVENITGQSREGWPEPELVEETEDMNAHLSLAIDKVLQFQQKSSDEAVIARLLPSVCSAKCADYVTSLENLEVLIRRHLSFGKKHEPVPVKEEDRDGTNTSN